MHRTTGHPQASPVLAFFRRAGAGGGRGQRGAVLAALLCACTAPTTTMTAPPAPPLHALPGGFTEHRWPAAHGQTVQVLERAERAAPLRYRVIVIPGSGCAGMGAVAERYSAGLLHAQVPGAAQTRASRVGDSPRWAIAHPLRPGRCPEHLGRACACPPCAPTPAPPGRPPAPHVVGISEGGEGRCRPWRPGAPPRGPGAAGVQRPGSAGSGHVAGPAPGLRRAPGRGGAGPGQHPGRTPPWCRAAARVTGATCGIGRWPRR